MPPTSLHSCTEPASYFSEKCRQCRFSCMDDVTGQLRSDDSTPTDGTRLSMLGSSAVIAGAAASFSGYPAMAAGLTVVGAVVIFAKLVR
jgi:hypothetical protein